MAFLNQSERESLKKELLSMSFGPAKRKVRAMDAKGRLVFYRNNQTIGQWVTRFELPSFGTRVTLVESLGTQEKKSGKIMSDYEFVDVVVEPTPDNRT
jgi:hypothetical protein